jgi:GST-like protein
MIDVYFWTTPNGYKPLLFLEEEAIPYRLVPVDINRGEQFRPEFLRFSPNNKIPALIDHAPSDGGAPQSVFESGAILLYLAEKYRAFLGRTPRERLEVIEWLFWQMAGLGPMLGQNHHFAHYAPEKIPYAIDRYVKEASRLYKVLDRRLTGRPFLVGDYSIADMACYPWVRSHQRQGIDLADFPQVARWFAAIAARPATVRAYAMGGAINPTPGITEEGKKILFGQSAASLESGSGRPG